jgi:hypothetical protein
MTTSEMRAALAAEQALIQKVIAAVRAFPLGHSHWDSTMQYGRGCELCIRQQKAKEDLMHSLTEAPAKAVAALATPSVASLQEEQLQCTQCGMVGFFPEKLKVGADGKFSISEDEKKELDELSKHTKFIQSAAPVGEPGRTPQTMSAYELGFKDGMDAAAAPPAQGATTRQEK